MVSIERRSASEKLLIAGLVGRMIDETFLIEIGPGIQARNQDPPILRERCNVFKSGR
jgi:hypothetical protein